MNNETNLIDHAAQQRLIDDTSEAAFESMMKVAVVELRDILAAVRGVDISTPEGIKQTAELSHRLFSTASNFGFPAVQQCCSALEQACRDNIVADIPKLHQEFIATVAVTLETFNAD